MVYLEVHLNKHGHIAFAWEKALLTLDVEGPFNEEGLNHYNFLIRQAILNRNKIHHHWQRLEIWDDEVMGSPGVITKCREMHDWYEKVGCILAAIVVSNNMQAQLLKTTVKSNAEIFSNVAEARKWLDSHQSADESIKSVS